MGLIFQTQAPGSAGDKCPTIIMEQRVVLCRNLNRTLRPEGAAVKTRAMSSLADLFRSLGGPRYSRLERAGIESLSVRDRKTPGRTSHLT